MSKSMMTALMVLCGMALCAAPEITVKLNKESGIYKCGEKISFVVNVTEDGKPISGRTIKYEILADGGVKKNGTYVCDAAKPFSYSMSLAKPGMMRVEFTLLDDKGKPIPIPRKLWRDQYRYISGRVGAVAEPEKILPAYKLTPEFKKFWAERRKELAAVPLKELERKYLHTVYGVKVYDIKVSCAGKRPVSAYLMIPEKAVKGKHPVMLTYHGAGVVSSGHGEGYNYARKAGFVVIDVNAHGILNGQPREYYKNLYAGELKNYSSQIKENPVENYRVGMILRVLRSLEYAKSLPEWNGKDLVVYGCSQGGYQAMIAAGLDSQVSLCRAGVPGYIDYHSEFFGDFKRIPRIHINFELRKRKRDLVFYKKILDNHIFFDPASFAPDIKCPVYATCGGCDISCPPTSVYAAYNCLPAASRKNMIFKPDGIHATSSKDNAADAAIMEIGKKAGFVK